MDNIREKIKNIKLLLKDHNLNGTREELVDEVNHLEGIIDYLETKNNSLREKVEIALKDVSRDLDTDLEEIGDILY